jgi:hypothetical protein
MVVLGGFALLLTYAGVSTGPGANPLPLLFYAAFLARAAANWRLKS